MKGSWTLDLLRTIPKTLQCCKCCSEKGEDLAAPFTGHNWKIKWEDPWVISTVCYW